MSQMLPVAKVSSLAEGKSLCVEAGGKKIALFRIQGAFYAIDDACNHRGGPLSEGECSGTTVACPWHGASFDLITGAAKSRPGTGKLQVYPVQVRGDELLIEC